MSRRRRSDGRHRTAGGLRQPRGYNGRGADACGQWPACRTWPSRGQAFLVFDQLKQRSLGAGTLWSAAFPIAASHWNRLPDAAGLTDDERRDAVRLFNSKVAAEPGTKL